MSLFLIEGGTLAPGQQRVRARFVAEKLAGKAGHTGVFDWTGLKVRTALCRIIRRRRKRNGVVAVIVVFRLFVVIVDVVFAIGVKRAGQTPDALTVGF